MANKKLKIKTQHNSSDIDSLVIKKENIYDQLNRFNEYINDFDPETSSHTQLKLRLRKIEDLWTQFETIHSSIVELNPIYKPDILDFEDKYFECVSIAQDLLDSYQDRGLAQSVHSSNISPHNNYGTTYASRLSEVRLPSIDLPSFSGSYEHWSSYYEVFKALIHENNNITDVHKFHYLRTSLKGEASRLIESLELSANNYFVAWKLLYDRYQDNSFIVQKHVRDLFNLPKIDKESASGLRSLLDSSNKHINSLQALKQPTESWDTLLVHLISSKFDNTTYREWQSALPVKTLPTYKNLTDFLEHRCQILESVNVHTHTVNKCKQEIPQPTNSIKTTFKNNTRCLLTQEKVKQDLNKTPSSGSGNNSNENSAHDSSQSLNPCPVCQSNTHQIYSCPTFLALSIPERLQKTYSLHLCTNCLRKGHRALQCRSSKCRRCGRHHNSLLHADKMQNSTNVSKPSTPNQSTQIQPVSNKVSVNCSSQHKTNSCPVLLATALVDVSSPNGTTITCRALLDCGSQSSFMTQSFANRLGLKGLNSSHTVVGIGSSPTHSSFSVTATLKSRCSNFTTDIRCLILPKITEKIPISHFNTDNFEVPNGILLADPTFNKPAKIDLLIGSDLFWDILGSSSISSQPGYPHLRESQLGWIISGRLQFENPTTSTHALTFCHLTTLESIDEQLKQFWSLENGQEELMLTGQDKICETLFQETTTRNAEGRYIVQMPLKSNPEVLGDSKDSALKRFYRLERRFACDPSLHKQYCEFMDQYEELGHMVPISEQDITTPFYYIPHHPVFKESSTTTKMRVVFDASAKSSNGISLNDIVMVGPTVQDDITSILLRFRIYNYVFCGDLEKMYRQIKILDSQTSLLLIFWRKSPQDSLKTYRLLTVTYGVGCSAFLATRALKQLSIDVRELYPEASQSISEDFYVDDYMSGRNTIEEARTLQATLVKALNKGGFHIRKWRANHPDLLYHIPPEDREMEPTLFIDKESTTKTLGLTWDPREDTFKFYFRTEASQEFSYTKRTVLSSIAKIFDPLGFIGPVILKAKVILQKLWKINELNWDDEIPEPILTEWITFKNTLNCLKEINIPRQVTSHLPPIAIEIHGFSDASELAYGASLYLKSVMANGEVKIELITSKSRVAPIKQVSLPRLELCGALLLAQLVSTTIASLKLNFNNIYLWTDSKIVLTWISAPSTHWTTFVANRVAKIQDLTESYKWNHVSGNHNPADIISRGSFLDNLITSNLWWQGPDWLYLEPTAWPTEIHARPVDIDIDTPERKKGVITLVSQNENNLITELLNRSSSFKRVLKIVALCLRFIRNLRISHLNHCNSTTNPLISGTLTVEEVETARILIIKIVQQQEFSKEYKDLSTHSCVNTKSNLISLSPFLSDQKLIRVGGRLNKSTLTPDQKQPIILPKQHKLTELIARDEHLRLLHAPPQLLLSSLRQRYWPLNGRNLARRIVHQCIICFKAKPKGTEQLMGDLPKARVEPARPFFHSGVDFCGPFFIKSRQGRVSNTSKCYIAVFICFSTKAIHLELVSDLTADAFLAAYRRFIARRGKCGHVYSDNGLNFVKANKELKILYNLLVSETSQLIRQELIKDNTQWHFIPTYTPTFGGLWEAGVKTVKYHLVRVVGNSKLTFEEFYTTLTQIESCINSRPLFPESNDPNDLSVLTPGHFLIGEATTTVPEPDLQQIPENRLSRWQYIQQLYHHFWRRWSKEYLGELQRRGKWHSTAQNIAKDTLVLIKDERLPPTKWTVGRVIDTHPGSDGLVRVVSIRTPTGVTKRGLSKICPLPITP